MEVEEGKRPASPETIKNLTMNLLQTIESTYHEMYVDMVLTEALRQGIIDEVEGVDRDYIEKVIRVHANVCYVVFSLCVQCRASLKSLLNVEKQYNIRRSVVTGHEMYKYLYGFTGKSTPWKEIEPILSAKYPEKCAEIAEAADDFLQKYAQEADGTLRDVSKHFSDNPTEFFKNYCCPIKIGIDYYSFETAFKQADLVLISKNNPSYVGKSSNCRIF